MLSACVGSGVKVSDSMRTVILAAMMFLILFANEWTGDVLGGFFFSMRGS